MDPSNEMDTSNEMDPSNENVTDIQSDDYETTDFSLDVSIISFMYHYSCIRITMLIYTGS